MIPILCRRSPEVADLKVLDLSTFWAGAYLTCYLGAFGAEIIKVESIQRPDGHRYSGAWAYEGDRWYERSAVWQGTNLNKRDVTLDLTSDRGRDLVRRLIRDADVVVENFSPRVIEQFGLDSESLVELKPDVILVRMPGFGLQGPWRDYVGWALNFEQTSGMAAATGYADGPPCNSAGACGSHRRGARRRRAARRARTSAPHRRRPTHRGRSDRGRGVRRRRAGDRILDERVVPSRARAIAAAVTCKVSTQPLSDDAWVALCVRDDADWAHMVEAMGRSDLLRDRAIRVGRTTAPRPRRVRHRGRRLDANPIARQKSSMLLAHSMFRQSRC